jgi:hypothetical protein
MTSPVSSQSGFGNVNTTRNIRAVQLLLGHNKLESTVRYLGIEVDANSKTKDGFGVVLSHSPTAEFGPNAVVGAACQLRSSFDNVAPLNRGPIATLHVR